MIRPGGGSALPGLVLSKLAPGLLAKTLGGFPGGLVVITGSAGKSTTTKMVVAILREHGLQVFTNPSTANIEQGFFSAIIEQSSIYGRISGDVAVLEMDEGHAASISERLAPDYVCLLNVLDDQLDRFVDPALVREKLRQVASRARRSLILNGDDQNILIISDSVKGAAAQSFFGIDNQIVAQTQHGLGYAPTYKHELKHPEANALVTLVSGQDCEVEMEAGIAKVTLPNRGLHFALDAVAALQTASVYLESKFDIALAAKTLNNLPPVFARGEVVEVAGQSIEFVLVQNPVSFQLNLDNLTPKRDRLMVAIGRDVHDPSWLWTVDFSSLNHVDIVSGYNCGEMALRFAYAEISMGLISDDLDAAFRAFLELPAPKSGVKTVLFSADSMRRLRRAQGFTSPDEVER